MASILPNGRTQFIDQNGLPLVGGQVFFYAPGTTNPQTTYQDQAQTIANTNPVQLDSRGQATIWGSGSYRQVVKDQNGVTIWDQVIADVTAGLASQIAAVTSGLSGAGGAAMVGFKPSGASVLRTVADSLLDHVSVKLWAKGDGVTDDSAAITAADAYCASAKKTLYFPDGTYFANNLSMTAGWHMDPGAKILYSGTSVNDVVVTCAVSNLIAGRINVDGNNTNPLSCFNITGSGVIVDEVNVSNVTCPPSGVANGAVKFLGNNNRIKRVYGSNLTGSNSNVSCPQLLTFGGSSTENVCEKLYGYNIRAGIVAYSTGAINFVGDADYVEIQDNGCYMPMGYVSVKSLRYHGYDEPIVSIGGGGDFGTVVVTQGGGANAVVGINNSSAITIGEILLHGTSSPAIILRSRGTSTQVCAPLKVGRISGGFYGNEPFYLNDTGQLDTLSIGSVDITHYYNSNSISGAWCELSAAQRLNIGKMNIKVVDTTNAITSIYMVINPGLAYPSLCDTIAVSIYNSDGVTPSTGAFFGKNFFQQNMTYVGAANVHNSAGYIQKWDGNLPHGGGLVCSSVPTVGYWKRGQVLMRQNPNAGATPGWVCVAAGTPGTWVQMALLQSS